MLGQIRRCLLCKHTLCFCSLHRVRDIHRLRICLSRRFYLENFDSTLILELLSMLQ